MNTFDAVSELIKLREQIALRKKKDLVNQK